MIKAGFTVTLKVFNKTNYRVNHCLIIVYVTSPLITSKIFNSVKFYFEVSCTNIIFDKNCPEKFVMNSKSTFGAAIRAMRKERKLPLRKVAAVLDIDPSTLSKIERNERSANKVMVLQLAELFEMDSDELLVSFLSDKVANELLEEENSEEVLKVAEEKIEYLKSKNVKQGNLNF